MPAWLVITLIISVSCLFCWFLSPDRQPKISRTQKVIATIWIIFRRLVAFLGALFWLFVLYLVWTSEDGTFSSKWEISLVALSLAVFFIYVGIFGQGWVQGSFSDDISLYKKIKEKYGFRW